MAGLAASPLAILLSTFLVLLPPTVLMGMSLPLLSRAIVDGIETASTRIGWLYGVNTLGAGLGALLTGWIVIGSVGYEITVYGTALINLVIGAASLLASTQMDVAGAPATNQTDPRRGTSTIRSRVLFWSTMVFFSGFLIISLEIVWFRVLGLLMQSNAYAFSLILAVFLVGDALGIVYGAETIGRISSPRWFFQMLQAVVALYALLTLYLISLAHAWFPHLTRLFVDGFIEPSLRRTVVVIGIVVMVVLPPAFLLGMSFPITQKAVQDDPGLVGRRVGLIQLSNILGNTAGAIITGLVFLDWLGTTDTLRLTGAIGLAFIATLLFEREQVKVGAWLMGRGSSTMVAIALAIVMIIFPPNNRFWLDLHGTSPERGGLVDEDRTGVAVVRPISTLNDLTYVDDASVGDHILYIGGHSQSRIPFLLRHGLLGVVGALIHPNPRDVLVIGHGTGGTPFASGINPATQDIRVVEIVRPVYEVMAALARSGADYPADAAIRDVMSNPRILRTVADARHILLTEGHRYDLIQADAIYPTSSHAGLLYSVEFFRQVRDRLKDGGISVQWAPTERTAATFLSVFPYVTRIDIPLSGSTGWFHMSTLLGSASSIPISQDEMLRRFNSFGRSYVAAGGWNAEEMLKALENAQIHSWGPNDPRADHDVNTDLFPKDEYYRNEWKLRRNSP
jgi:spermidine synthase